MLPESTIAIVARHILAHCKITNAKDARSGPPRAVRRAARPRGRAPRSPLWMAGWVAAFCWAHVLSAPPAMAGSSAVVFLAGTVPPSTGLSFNIASPADADRNVLGLTIETNAAGGVEVTLAYGAPASPGAAGLADGLAVLGARALGLVAPAAGPGGGRGGGVVPYDIYSGGELLDFSSGRVNFTNGNGAALELRIVFRPQRPRIIREAWAVTPRYIASAGGDGPALGGIAPAAGTRFPPLALTLVLTLAAA